MDHRLIQNFYFQLLSYLLEFRKFLKCLKDSEFLDRLNYRKWRYLHKTCFFFWDSWELVILLLDAWLKVDISPISQMKLQFNNYRSIDIYRYWQHITNSVSLYRYIEYFSLFYLQIPLSTFITATFLNNILFDLRTFSSFLKFCYCFGATSTSKLLETS